MKPFLCADKGNKTADNRLILNGSEFQTALLDREIYAAYSEELKKNKELKNQAETPNILRAVQVFSGLIAIIALLTAGSNLINKVDPAASGGFSYLELFGVAIIGAAICVAVCFYIEKRKKRILEGEAVINSDNKLKELALKMQEMLGVPEDAESVDVLAFGYKEAEGNIGIVPDKNGYKNADNCRFRLFKEGEDLVLCSLDKKYSFKLSSLKALTKEKMTIHLSYWHKEKSYKDESFKEYNLSLDNSKVMINECIILSLERDVETEEGTGKELWGIYFPNYEIKSLKKVLGEVDGFKNI